MKKATLAVHAGSRPEHNLGGINTPVVNSAANAYTRDSEVRYPRYFNMLNHAVVADRIAALEDAEAGLVTSSGMAAISAIVLGLLDPGDHAVFLEGLYGGTHYLVVRELERLGIEHDFVAGNADAFAAAMRPNTRMVFIESPTNPLLEVVDLAAIAAVAHDHGALAVIDNTFATPILQNPVAHGFDLVMHSGTKYLGGHSDLCCGAVAGSAALIRRLTDHATAHGCSLNAPDCALLERSLKTLDLRVRAQSRNAGQVAQALAQRDGIARVRYPGLPGHPGHELAARQMHDFGAMLSFELDQAVDPDAFLERLELITPAVSLGGVETIICQPIRTSHAKMEAAERERLGITPRLLRLSVGIEDPSDLVDDLSAALAG